MCVNCTKWYIPCSEKYLIIFHHWRHVWGTICSDTCNLIKGLINDSLDSYEEHLTWRVMPAWSVTRRSAWERSWPVWRPGIGRNAIRVPSNCKVPRLCLTPVALMRRKKCTVTAVYARILWSSQPSTVRETFPSEAYDKRCAMSYTLHCSRVNVYLYLSNNNCKLLFEHWSNQTANSSTMQNILVFEGISKEKQ